MVPKMDDKIENYNSKSPCNNTRTYTEYEIINYERRLVFGYLEENEDEKQCDQIYDGQ